ncbi:MAG: helix-turn-helix domain-containing protein [candidate division Zixibacteria bacterium]|nr:helix-turn-helix domain-containing protein [candidate division Zixibacteria bacterium]
MMKLSYDEMFEAMSSNDSGYDGRFYVGVHSTGIYCLPSCKAKLPRPENIVFYDSREEAIAAGLRGCKRCRSETFPDVLPSWLHDVLKYMRENFNEKLNESQLIEMASVDISTVRRYFRNYLGTTPLAFHRRQRLLYARRLLETGTDYLNAAYECGYNSVSGFREAFTRQFGKPPGRYYAR